MTPAEIITLSLEIGNRIDVQWGLFVTVHMALLGALAYVDKPLHPAEKLFAIVVYLGFAAINYGQMSTQLELLNAAYADVARLAGEANASELVQRIASEQQGVRRYASLVLKVSHIAMLVLVILSLVFHPIRAKRKA
ncbi:MAG: hypothetical protein AAGI67_18130 [Pseudomonadota bacterium]